MDKGGRLVHVLGVSLLYFEKLFLDLIIKWINIIGGLERTRSLGSASAFSWLWSVEQAASTSYGL